MTEAETTTHSKNNGPTAANLIDRADEISSYASKNEMPEQGMNYIDWLLWYMLRDIYTEFRQGSLDKEQGAARKKHAIDIWEKESFRCEQSRQLAVRMSDTWKNVEAATSRYRKNRTVQNADLILVAMYGAVDAGDPDNEQTSQADMAASAGQTTTEGGDTNV